MAQSRGLPSEGAGGAEAGVAGWLMQMDGSWEGRREPGIPHGCVLSAVDPPRPIPNRVVKRRSADATGAGALGT